MRFRSASIPNVSSGSHTGTQSNERARWPREWRAKREGISPKCTQDLRHTHPCTHPETPSFVAYAGRKTSQQQQQQQQQQKQKLLGQKGEGEFGTLEQDVFLMIPVLWMAATLRGGGEGESGLPAQQQKQLLLLLLFPSPFLLTLSTLP